ncbi:MAG: hypothetical protein MUP20_00730, partial [Methyloceanibacter sp.]|nr:hypothetical protein [Methyloceanibacter sp.]
RGKRLVVLVGQKKAVAIAVRNVSGRRRWSKLNEWLAVHVGGKMMSDDLQAFRERAARAVAKVARGSAADNADRHIRMADAVIAEFAKPTDAMIDAAYEAVRFDEAWAINSRRDFVKAVKAMVRSVLGKHTSA